jgi:hypothetical protein
MAVKTGSGTKLYISTTVPASTVDTAAEWAALTWTKVGYLTSLGDFGDESSQVDFVDMETSRVLKLAGPADAGTLAATCGWDPLDAGQVAMISAQEDGFEYGFKIELNDAASEDYTNTIVYFRGVVLAQRIANADPRGVRTVTFNVPINNAPLYVMSEAIP